MSEESKVSTSLTWRDRLHRALGLDDEIENLREQFYVTLRAYLARIEAGSPKASPALERVRLLLALGRRPRWSECYEVEQLLVWLFDEATLSTELDVRLLEAKANLRPALYEYYASATRPPKDNVAPNAERRRTLLARLVNDLQWRYTMQEGKRRFSKSLTTRTGVAFLLTFSAFAALVTLVYVKSWQFAPGDLRLLAAASVAGAWGATFSMLTGLAARIKESPIYELNVMRAVTMLAARALVGAGAASVLYLFFSSGFLAGAAFPDLTSAENTVVCRADAGAQCLRAPALALLVIWCFLAGFSEKLVPGLLAKAEAKVDGAPASEGSLGGQHYRPTEAASSGPKSGVVATSQGDAESAPQAQKG